MVTQTHYEVLEVTQLATEKEVIQAYRILIRQHHPDRVGPSGEAMTMLLNHAYDVLSDPAKRRSYDRTLPGAPPEPPPSGMTFSAPPPPTGKPAAPAASSPSWTAPTPGQSYRTQEPTATVVPTKRDWAVAFPPGSRPRLALLGVSVLMIASGLMLALRSANAGSALWVLLSVFGGALLLKRRPHWLSYVMTVAMLFVGVSGMFWPERLTSTWGGTGLTAAGVGWASLALVARSWKTLRRRHVEARDWVILEQVAVATGDGPLWVRAVEGKLALVEDGATGAQRSITVWGDVHAGTWVVLNSAGSIVDTTPGTAFTSFQWVEKDRVRRAGIVKSKTGRHSAASPTAQTI
jgi:hypothetical protein